MMVDKDTALAGFLGTLLPGGSGFPPARELHMVQMLAARLGQLEPDPTAAFASFLESHGGVPTSAASWLNIVLRFEAVEPGLFSELRKYAYLTYYEQPATIDAIRALGFRYKAAPLPDGYPDEPFASERDAPRHRRGRWIPTTEVQRVDLTGLGLED